MQRAHGGAAVRRRRPLPPAVLGLLLVGLVGLGLLAALALRQTGMEGADADDEAAGARLDGAPVPTAPTVTGVSERAARRSPSTDRSSRGDRRSMGRAGRLAAVDVDGDDPLELGLPGRAVWVAFGEGRHAEALALRPHGELVANGAEERFDPPEATAGPAYRVLAPRARSRPPTSAALVGLPDDGLAAAPVSGTVVEVRDYVLRGRLRDWRVVIEPDARRDLRVVLTNLHRPRLAVDERVSAGETTVGAARLPAGELPGLEAERPLLRIEVTPAVEPEPFDPNRPAVEPEGAGERLAG